MTTMEIEIHGLAEEEGPSGAGEPVDDIKWEPLEPVEDVPEDEEQLLPMGLPESTYSAAIIIPMLKNLGKTDRQRQMLIVQIILATVVTIYVQAILVAYVFDFYVASKNEFEPAECGGYTTQPFLRQLCITIYTAAVMRDLGMSFKMAMFTWHFNESDEWKYLQYEINPETEETRFHKDHGMTLWYKRWVFGGIIIPRFCIALFLLAFGAGFVVNTDSAVDLILNALALEFILVIDEMMYAYFLTFQMQGIMEDLPKIDIPVGKALKWNKTAGMFIKAFCLFLLTWTTYTIFCPEDSMWYELFEPLGQ